ncbi:MAG: hypothetical protein COV44_11430 [Deltaproteobacteria bacterium CG11_big_fil_rev_8_21_14_0_20_45_16]|nr:MAG: hypothetical protein COV44_11430 [Deltaproteobacteria bacterium CG11_big_fil_rev_8_21_14_0_20_45_16]
MKKRIEGLYFGRNILREALEAEVEISEIYYDTDAAFEFINSLKGVKTFGARLVKGLPAIIKNQAHQGVAFWTPHTFYRPLRDYPLNKQRFVILCNHVQDIHNFGSIVRCAVAFGAGLLIHEEKGSAELTAAAMKSSAGLAFRLSFCKVEHLSEATRALAKNGFRIIGLDAGNNAQVLRDWIPQFPLALVLGSEGEGISVGIKKYCESLVSIPMERAAESLNVSHAAAIAMNWVYEGGQGG